MMSQKNFFVAVLSGLLLFDVFQEDCYLGGGIARKKATDPIVRVPHTTGRDAGVPSRKKNPGRGLRNIPYRNERAELANCVGQ